MALGFRLISSFHYRTDAVARLWMLLLWPWTLFYRGLWALRQYAYQANWFKTVRVAVPVVSIGNLTTGGTGKTPIIIALAEYLEEQGLKVVVLSRGYGAKKRQHYAQATHPDYGDEAYLIQQHLRTGVVMVGKNRQRTAQWALKDYQPDIILLDDGFQYQGLERDLDVVLIDGIKGFGNHWLLPAGPLREPLSAIKRATHVWVTKTIVPDQLNELRASLRTVLPNGVSITECPFQASHLFHPFSGRHLTFVELGLLPYIVLSGIAHPDVMEEEAQRRLKGDMVTHIRFDDHHGYKESDIEDIMLLLKRYENCQVITTGKDWVKIKGMVIPEFLNRFYIFEMKPVFPFSALLGPILEPSATAPMAGEF